MKKILLLLLLVTGFSNAQIVNIPDANFKAKLLSANTTNTVASNASFNPITIDTNGDSEIQVLEAQAVVYLDITSSNISNLSGIESFVNLKRISANFNSITTATDLTALQQLEVLTLSGNAGVLPLLNVSGLTNLFNLSASPASNITTLNASGCTSLVNFSMSTVANINLSNCSSLLTFPIVFGLHTVNFSGCTSLATIYCDNNNLTTLDVSGLTSLTYLNCRGNQLTSLNIQGTNLTDLNCEENFLTSLDLSNSPNITSLDCSINLFTTLDVSNLTSLNSFYFGHNPMLESVNLKNGRNEYLSFGDSPNLVFICADEVQVASIQASVQSALPNAIVTSYCSFNPGGNYSTITGSVTFDQNNNGCDVNDLNEPHFPINFSDGTPNSNFVFTNLNGNYTIYTLSTNVTLTPHVENPSWFIFSPSSVTIPLSTTGNTVTQNFCFTPAGVHNDVEVIIASLSPARPGFDTSYQVIYRNKGNQSLSGTVQFAYEDDVLDYVSSTQTPDFQTAGNLTWNYTNLLPFEVRTVTIVMNVNSPMETPAVNIGDQLDFTATINPISGDETPLDNVFGLKQIVVGSFDPNDKACLEGSIVSTSKIGDYLHYTINFENTGTFPATFVVVKDMIDTTKFDIATLQVLNASHQIDTRVDGNKVEFIFDAINLGPNQHGNVTFKVKTKSTLVAGNTVTNRANIYFDYNFPIETNTASTTFQVLSNGEFSIDSSVVIAPNPTKNNVNVNCNSNIQSIQLFDVQGRVLITQLVNDSQSSIDVSNYFSGIYFVKVLTEEGSKVEKIIKE